MVDDGVVVYAVPLEGRRLLGVLPYTPEEVAVPADATHWRHILCLYLLVSCLPLLLVRRRFLSLWKRDGAAASAGPSSSRGRWYYIEGGFRTIASSANPNSQIG